MKPITVTRWPAKDGSLHETASDADRRNRYIAGERRISAVRAVVEDKVRDNHFGALLSLFSYDPYAKRDKFEQDRFLDDLARLIIDHLSDITEACARSQEDCD